MWRSVEASAGNVLASAAWLLLTFAMATLWLVAMAEIWTHARRGVFTAANLASMAAAVTVAAVVAFATLSAAFPPTLAGTRPVNAVAAGGSGCEGARGTFVFSFGIERPIYASRGCEGS